MHTPFPPSSLQASAIPYRVHDGRLEICLITSLSSGRWGFPKGLIDPGETAVETALKEAHEEGGLRGRVVGEPLGEYQYAKWGVMLTVTVFLMHVQEADETWLEADRRQRRWVTADVAADMLDRKYLARVLRLAVKRLEEQA